MRIEDFRNDHNPVIDDSTKFFNNNAVAFKPESESSVYAKHRRIKYADGKENNTFYVLFCGNELYNPVGIDSHKKNKSNINLKQVNQQVFDMYMLYLRTKNGAYFTKANRRVVDGS